jgi:putative hemolysin
MSEISTEILIILVLLLINGVLAMSEAALISARKVRLQQRANEGDKQAGAALKLMSTPNKFLSTVQIGITLVGVLSGAVGGASIVDFLSPVIAKVTALAPYSEEISFGLVVVLITYASLILGELVPKRLALQNPENIASAVARPMVAISTFFSPVVRILSISTDSVLRLLGIRASNEPPVTEEEIHVLLDQGTQAGVFEEAEQDMVAGVFSLSDRRVYSLMTPRTEIVWLDVRDSTEEILNKMSQGPFSRYPVCQGSLDNVLGIVKARDMLIRNLAGQPINLKETLSPAVFIPETTFGSRALEIFKEGNKEFLLVIDEYGGVTGLLTINDVLEEIVGDIEIGEPRVTQRQDGSWLLDGMLDIDEFKEIFSLKELPNEGDYETLAGFVMSTMGRIPRAADQFEWEGLRFEVVDMDARRIDKVLVTTLPARPVPN